MITTLAMGAAMTAALVHLYRQDQRRGATHRARAFENCRGVLEDAELIHERGDYPMLRGTRDGRNVELRLISENVNIRKLPVLWLLVTVRRALPVGCAFDMLLRPQNTEFYSPHHRLDHRLPTPADWPEQASLRCSEPNAGRLLIERLTPHIAFFNQDPRGKELFVGPGGVRLVYMVDEATRSRYLTLRQAVYERDIIARDLLETLIRKALTVGADLSEVPNGEAEPEGSAVPSLHRVGVLGRADGNRAGSQRPTVAGPDDGIYGAGLGLGQLQPHHS